MKGGLLGLMAQKSCSEGSDSSKNQLGRKDSLFENTSSSPDKREQMNKMLLKTQE
jgi:hypothetical protein